MKKILYHFRISTMLGLAILAGVSGPIITKNKFYADSDIRSDGEVLNPENPQPPESSDPVEDIDPQPDVEPEPDFEYDSDLIIKAINPGYTVDGTRDVGEFIELQKLSDITPFSLAGYAIWYVNSSGNRTLLFDFSEGSLLAGETLLMRLARSPESDQADATYATTLAMGAGRIELLHDEAEVDSVCWGAADCEASFKGAKPTTLVRDLASGKFAHLSIYLPVYNGDSPNLILPQAPDDSPDGMGELDPPEGTDDGPENPDQSAVSNGTCVGVEFSEVYSYYANSQSEQFIEFYNRTDSTIALSNCVLRYKNKTYPLDSEVPAGAYQVYYPSQNGKFSLTKNPSSTNVVELLDKRGNPVDVLVYEHGQKKSASFAKFYDSAGAEYWQSTYNLTPGQENIYQEFRSCADGKVINPATGNCVKATSATITPKTCAEGQYLNPLTGRCKKIQTEAEAKPCQEGYERNPNTGRCRKIVRTNDGAEYALVPGTYSSKSSFTALGIVLSIVAAGVTYVVLQFRREILRAVRKIRQRVHHAFKNLIAWRRGIDRHKQT